MAINNARIDLSHLTRIADDPRIKPAHLSTLPDQSFQGFLDMQETLLQQKYTTTAETDDHPAYQPYAKVVVGGKVVAEIDNHGWTASSNAFGAQIQQGLPQTGAGGEIDGPELARARAEYIAAQTGGRVEMADTVLTQQEFSAVPSLETRLDKNRDDARSGLSETHGIAPDAYRISGSENGAGNGRGGDDQ